MANRRRVRMDKFKAQLAEEVIGEDSLVELEIAKGEYVTIYIPVDPEKAAEFGKELQGIGSDSEAGALLVLGNNPTVTAAEQFEKWQAAGFDVRDLLLAYSAEAQSARERLGKFRYRG